ncbi:5'-nucleotidase C-terminal domain-containing protein [Spongiimicrobium salis]|uniref:5'-nucleotidase C-terminal domain-containing protein n=1 Tax=Spongiimicrobium salis TaxID=1667022 RepID=UPI00374C8C4D
MVLKIKHFVIFITIIGFCSCKQEKQHLQEIKGAQLKISNSIPITDSIENFVAPYRNRINVILDSTLAYAPKPISKTDGKFNTTAGNLLADIVWEQSTPIFEKRTEKKIDFVLLNHGGIRSIISKGKVTARTAYEVMPFENTVVVVALDGKAVRELLDYLVDSKRAHPISGIQILLDKNAKLKTVRIQGESFDENKTYYVATSNYLVNGGDNMSFFRKRSEQWELDYTIRNTMIDYFMKYDTIAPSIDQRFAQIN